MIIKVMGRGTAEMYVPTKKCAFISITSPYSDPAELIQNDYCIDVLRLSFHDWNEKEKAHISQLDSDEARKMIYFNDDMAKQIVEFVKRNVGQIEELIVHCEAGISRSAGCAAAICKSLGGDDTYYFKHYLPNSLVYSTIVRVFNDER